MACVYLFFSVSMHECNNSYSGKLPAKKIFNTVFLEDEFFGARLAVGNQVVSSCAED